eukprot:TRINITY_DN1507_c0_g1_i3.p1 TRINITY_DN1507_c0_g1~~TRINITY_DN1507_c0_g1_i3.p1  ORF type:complete len:438 (-),score=109.58 TRINITY_DN1507_c0_g1_i3:34-1296(-)
MTTFVSLILLAIIHTSFADSGVFMHVSDLHLDSDYSTQHTVQGFCRKSTVNPLSIPMYCHNFAIQQSACPTTLGRYGCDAPAALVRSSIAAMKRAVPNPDFILFTGDFGAHMPKTKDIWKDNIAQGVAIMKEFFPNTLIIPSVGNNDFYSDYVSSCSDESLEYLSNALSAWIPESQMARFKLSGSLEIPINDNLVAISFNSVLYSANGANKDDCSQNNWLSERLESAKINNRKVFLVSHIPPVIDDYNAKHLWTSESVATFSRIVSNYSSVIAASFFGHVHKLQFKFLSGPQEEKIAPIFVTNSISPVLDNNPAFNVFNYTRQTGSLLDLRTHFLDLETANCVAENWLPELDFQKTFGTGKPLDLNTMKTIVTQMSKDPVLLSEYTSRTTGMQDSSRQKTICAMMFTSKQSFDNCLSKFN